MKGQVGFTRRMLGAAVLAAAVGLTACVKEEGDKVPLGDASGVSKAPMPGDPGTPTKAPQDLTDSAKVWLEAGNVAYRKKDYAVAKVEYTKAAKESPDHAAPWFGIYMVAKATNDAPGQEAALAEIRKRNAPAPVDHMGGDTTAARRAHEKAGVNPPPKG